MTVQDRPIPAQTGVADENPELLIALHGPGYQLRLRLANEQLDCRADLACSPSTAAEEQTPSPLQSDQDSLITQTGNGPSPATEKSHQPLTPALLISTLRRCGVEQEINFPALYDFCAAAAEGHSCSGVLLARGKLPRPGEDGWFEMEIKSGAEPAEFREDSRGYVDLRTRHSHTEIEAGQKLGRVHPPKPGHPGVTVHGLPIPADPGKTFDLIAGDGVELKYEGKVAIAAKAGRAILEQRHLSVVDQLSVTGDLDLQVGNIDFHGFVDITGDVPDDFIVKARKGLSIRGVVGASHIESGAGIEIGSMAGKEIGEIICHGDLRANFLNQARIFCYGNVLVRNEIRNSQVKATGKIIVERGGILGGKCVSLEGIEARSLGSTSGLKTLLVAGSYFPDDDRFDFLQERLKQIDRQLRAIHEALGPLEKFRDRGRHFDNASEMRLDILNQQWEKLEREKDAVLAEVDASTHQEFSCRNPKINVHKMIHEGVRVILGGGSELYKFPMNGPVSLIENSLLGRIRHLSLSPLSTLASTMEKPLLEEEAAELETQL